MGENERRRGYAYNRVLIESDRVLDPEFNDAVVFLSGAQIELLRNVTQYLNRLSTYVSEYNPGYYLVPTDEDFDDILEIVADMEETLMGNPNTIWGYKERWVESQSVEGIGAGSTYVDSDPVPEGYVYVLQHWMAVHAGGGPLSSTVYSKADGNEVVLFTAPALASADYALETANLTLSEGDYISFRVVGLPVSTYGYLRVSGYKMAVPA